MDPVAQERLEQAFPIDQQAVEPREHFVTALLVAHNGEEWLPDTLRAILGQTRPVDLIRAGGTTEEDGCIEMLKVAFDDVVQFPPVVGFPGAVSELADTAPVLPIHDQPIHDQPIHDQPSHDQPSHDQPSHDQPSHEQPIHEQPIHEQPSHELTHDEPSHDTQEVEIVSWIWVLHDDSAPDPHCLAQLLASSDRFPQAGILLPKAVTWPGPAGPDQADANAGVTGDRVLVDVGRLWAPGFPEVRQVDLWEHDQGQHDYEREVYSGDSAGMLIRADLWHWLSGPDPDAGPAWAADLCRRTWGCGWEVWFSPAAVIAHRRAGHHAVRPGTSPRTARAATRSAQLYLELTQATKAGLPWRYSRALATTAGRFTMLTLTRELDEALGELDGAWSVLAHPARVRRGRSRARREPVETLQRPPGLQAQRGIVIRRWIDELLAGPRGASLRPWRPKPGQWPALIVFGVLCLISLMRGASTLFGVGALQGGGLLPADTIGTTLARYFAGWHEVGVGSDLPMPSYTLVLGIGSLATFGSVDLLLRLMVTFYTPLAFISAYTALGSGAFARPWSREMRLPMALAYAVLPAGIAAAASGRLSTVGLGLLLPWLLRTLLAVRTPPQQWLRRAIWAGLLLGISAAFAPLTWLFALIWAVISVARSRRRAVVARFTGVLVAVASLIVIWQIVGWARHPWTMLFEVGVNSEELLPASLPPWFALGLSPGGPGSPAVTAGLALTGAALVTVLIRPSRPGVAWLAVLAASAIAATLATAKQFPQLSSGQPLAPWTGQFLLVCGAAAVMACAYSLRLPSRETALAARPQRLAPVLTMALIASGAGLALVGAGLNTGPGATSVSAAEPLPAVAAAAGTSPERARSLVLGRAESAALSYYLTNGVAAALGDADVALADPAQELLTETVSRLASGSGGAMGSVLPERAVAYVVFNGSITDPVVAALDATPGLRRLSGHSDDALWLVTQTSPRAELSTPTGQTAASAVTIPVKTVPTSIDVILHPQMAVPRELRLAERNDPGWHLELAGNPLPVDRDQPFVRAIVASTGTLTAHHQSPRGPAAALQLGLLMLALLLAAPKRRPLDQAGVRVDARVEVRRG